MSVSVCKCLSVCVCLCVAKAEVESRLGSAQTALMLQEDAIHRGDCEHKQMLDNMSSLERARNILESEKLQLQVMPVCLSAVYVSLSSKFVSNSSF